MTAAPIVLNVNDHVANLYMVSKMLRNAGFQVVEARTGHEALAHATAAATKPDLVVLDVRLPDIDGFEVCRRLKADPRPGTSRCSTRRRPWSRRRARSRGSSPAPMAT